MENMENMHEIFEICMENMHAYVWKHEEIWTWKIWTISALGIN